MAKLMKLAWSLLTEDTDWSVYMRGKYMKSDGEWYENKSSTVWLGMKSALKLVRRHQSWIIGDGRSINIWRDHWVGDMPLADYINPNSDIWRHLKATLSSCIDRNNWCWPSQFLQIANSLGIDLNLVPRPNYEISNERVWPHSRNGKLTTKSAYDVLKVPLPKPAWLHYWKTSSLHPRDKTMSWKLLHGAIATDDKVQRRNVTMASQCVMCKSEQETRHHLWYQCGVAKAIWDRATSAMGLKIDINSEDDMRHYCRRLNSSLQQVWKTLSLAIMVQLWKTRNKCKFEEAKPTVHSIWHQCTNTLQIGYSSLNIQSNVSVSDLVTLKSLQLQVRPRKAPMVVECYWALPPPGFIKVNVDGASRGNPGKSGWGAVFRDSKGGLKGVYIGGLGNSTNYIAETMAVIYAAQKAVENNWLNIWIEGDSETVISGFQRGDMHWLAKREWAKIQQQATYIILSYNKREVNFSADSCAKKGVHLSERETKWWPGNPSFSIALENNNSTYYRFVG